MLPAIVDNLSQQKGIYEGILSLSREEQKAIIAADAQRVQELAYGIMEQLRDASRLEEDRRELVNRFLEERAERRRDITLEELCNLVGENSAGSLHAAGEALSQVIAEQRAVNELNRELLQLHFQYINFMIDALAQQAQPTQTSNLYDAGGRESFDAPQTLGILDSQI